MGLYSPLCPLLSTSIAFPIYFSSFTWRIPPWQVVSGGHGYCFAWVPPRFPLTGCVRCGRRESNPTTIGLPTPTLYQLSYVEASLYFPFDLWFHIRVPPAGESRARPFWFLGTWEHFCLFPSALLLQKCCFPPSPTHTNDSSGCCKQVFFLVAHEVLFMKNALSQSHKLVPCFDFGKLIKHISSQTIPP